MSIPGMRALLLAPVVVVAAACHSRPEMAAVDAAPRAPASASVAAASSATPDAAAAAPAGDAATSDATVVSTGTCSLSREERAALEGCLWDLVKYRVGIRGSFRIHVKMTRDAGGAARASSRVDQERWREAPAGTCLADLARSFDVDAGKGLPCAWVGTGPYPVWKVSDE